MKLPRTAIVLSIIAGAVLVLGVCAALLPPRIVDSQMSKDKISAELAKRFAGSLVIGKIELLWFPRPHAVIENTDLSPTDIGGELLNLPAKNLGTPLDAIRLFAPSGENREEKSARSNSNRASNGTENGGVEKSVGT